MEYPMSIKNPGGKAAAAIEDIFPLTGLQEGMYAEYRVSLERNSADDSPPSYNEQFVCVVDGSLQLEQFEQAWNDLAMRHPMLRTAFTELPGKGLVQVVLKSRPVRFSFEDISHYSNIEEISLARATEARREAFDLARDSLVRVRLLQTRTTQYRLVFTLHHLIFDAWCAPILVDDLMAIYARAIGCGEGLLAPPRSRFGDVVRSQVERRGAASNAFWHDYLTDMEGMSPLPFLNKEAAPGAYDSAVRIIAPATVVAMANMAGQLSIPSSSILHAIWGWVLARLQDRDEVLLSVVRANRPAEFQDIDRVIGMFISTVLLRVNIASAESIGVLFQRVHHDLQMTAVWSAASLAEMMAAGGMGAGQIDHTIIGRNELLSGGDETQLNFPASGVTLSEFQFESWDHYDFQIGFSLGREACFEAKFRHGRFSAANVARILDMMMAALEIAVQLPEANPNTVPLFDEDHLANATLSGPETVPSQPLPFVINEVLARYGKNIVTTDGYASLSGAELTQAIGATARMLRDTYGVTAGDRVAIVVEPGNDVLVAILAVWHIGAAFVPLGADWPPERTVFVVADSHAKVILIPMYWYLDIDCVCPQEVIRQPMAGDHIEAPASVLPDIAYIIYTSGSTGRPKGVAVGMESLTNYCFHAIEVLGLRATDVALQVSSPAFDLGYTTLFPVLLAGGTIHWTSRAILVDPHAVIETMSARRINIVKCTPSYLRLLLSTPERQALSSLTEWRLLVMGGEGFDRRDLDLLGVYCPWLRVVNHYGPTEATIGCTMMPLGDIITASKVDRQIIGTPVANSRAHIRDRHGSPLPCGVEGELVIEGAALARGYIDGTTGGFFRQGGKYYYRTGDRARIIGDGCLEYLGRTDSMIKIRGFRVNLLETEVAIRQLPEVDDVAVVVDQQGDTNESELLAFVQSAATDLQPADIKRSLAARLLPAQIPGRIIFVSRLLITENGKPDRGAMMRNAIKGPKRAAIDSPPETKTEKVLAAIWQCILKVENVTTEDDFFALGGHSLRALQVAAEVRRELGEHLSVRTFFEYPILADLAQRIDHGPLEEKSLITLRRHDGGGRALCLPPALGVASVYKEMIDLMRLDIGVDGINCPALLDGKLAPTLEVMVEEMLAKLPDKGARYELLIGWSFGATLAVEMARQLEKKGQTVKLLLLDGRPRQQGEGGGSAFEGLTALSSRRYWSQVIVILRRTMTPDQLSLMERLASHNLALWNNYAVGFRLNSDILAVEAKTSVTLSMNERKTRLGALTRGRTDVISTSGDHYSMFHPQHLEHWLGAAREFVRTLTLAY